jgi:hypothetical protein
MQCRKVNWANPFVIIVEKRLSMLFLFDVSNLWSMLPLHRGSITCSQITLLDAGRDHGHFARKWTLSEWKGHVVNYQALMDGTDAWNTNYLENVSSGQAQSCQS